MGKRLKARRATGADCHEPRARARPTELVAKALGIKRGELRSSALYSLARRVRRRRRARRLPLSCARSSAWRASRARDRLLPDLALDNLPTSGIVAIDLSTPSWRNAATASAKLAYYDYPKNPELIVTEN
jgi:hypothetical protein